ncbi:hypothetical protein DFJ73DRAFT_778645 [Zopfochytrium polystomum]|nr:hypothetical protein DFJ73DRAFT_778645 [Zopfochytrium polystomum]
MPFTLYTYHTSYRAMILIWHDGRRPAWAVAAVVALIELSINIAPYTFYLALTYTGTVLIQTNLLKYFSLVRDTTTQRITTALIAYVSLVDSGFFILTQLRIVSVMRQVRSGGGGETASYAHYVDAALRCVCFTGAVFLYFTTLNGSFFDPSEGFCFLATAPALIQIVLLTDSDRIRKLVQTLRGETVSRSGSDATKANALRSTATTGQRSGMMSV